MPNTTLVSMIINLLKLPDSYWLHRERMSYHQAGGFPHGGNSKFLVYRVKISENR